MAGDKRMTDSITQVILPLAMQEQAHLKAYNTFALDARARHFVELSDMQQLPALFALLQQQEMQQQAQQQDAQKKQQPFLLLGGGSNVLLVDDFPGIVIHVALRGIQLLQQTPDTAVVEVMAGETWHDFVQFALRQGWYGLENLSLIPGTVGAAPIQNIGAYGVEVKECIAAVDYVDLHDGSSHTLSPDQCAFSYRDSIFKHALAGRALITRVHFCLSRVPQMRLDYGDIRGHLNAAGISAPTPLQVAEAVCAIRRSKLPDPAVIGNAGSFFKNPLVGAAQHAELKTRFPALVSYPQADGSFKLAAGWLIDQSGWKGYRDGDAGVHDRQALVLCNHGKASGRQILMLSERIISDIDQRFGVRLEREPVLVERDK